MVTPSNWLADLARISFFSNRKIVVINNGIDTSLFRKTDNEFRKTHHLERQKIILCIANIFDERKGLLDVIKLSKMLSADETILMVGKIKGKIKMPKNIVHVGRTDSVRSLVDIYSSCDVMFNPTYEDTYSSTNLEALSCGLPVVCYKTGGAIETVDSKFIIEQGDIAGACRLIRQIMDKKVIYTFPDLDFSKTRMHASYLKLIQSLLV